jgi:transcriptional regulator with XRE-family HTH domain
VDSSSSLTDACHVANTDDLRNVFGRAVRRVRTERNLSQERLAGESGLDRSYVGGIERGDRNPSLLAIGKIACALEISLADLFAACDFGDSLGRDARGGRG